MHTLKSTLLRTLAFIFFTSLAGTPAYGQVRGALPEDGGTAVSGAAGSSNPAVETAEDGGTQVRADQFEYRDGGRRLILTGNVVIDYDGTVLSANRVTYNRETEEATAFGNVRFDDGARVWEGERLNGNFATDVWDFGLLTTFYDPFYIISKNTQQVDRGHWVSEDPIVTTCDPEDKEFYFTARVADIYSERLVRMEGVKFMLNNVPVMYLPVYTLDLDRRHTNFDFLPGYGSRDGVYALMAYSWALSQNAYTTTHLDLRSERGVAVGQSLTWFDRADKQWQGKAQAYFALDQQPYTSDDREVLERQAGINIDEERYRLRLSHVATLGPNDMVFAEVNHLSDREVVKDFFEEEYRSMPDPENRLSYIYTDSLIQAGAEVQYNLNEEDFGGGNRLPEVRLQVSPVRLGDSAVFYESFSSAGFYEQTYSDFEKDVNGLENYDTPRIHTQHTLTLPQKYFGWLNLIPRAGYAGTFYGDTPGAETILTNIVQNVSTNGVINFETNTTSVVSEGDAELRNLLELGFETSFKAFKAVHEDPIGGNKNGLRHVIEPNLRYTFIPDADPEPAELYQFDAIDRLEGRNDVRLGLRNKLQTRVRHQSEEGEYWGIRDFADVEVFTTYDLDPDPDEDSLETVGVDAEFALTDHTFIDLVAYYDLDDGSVSRANSRFNYYYDPDHQFRLEHAFYRDNHSVLVADWDWGLTERWGLEGYSRYDMENGDGLEEQMLMVTRKTDCVGYGLGMRWIAGDEIIGSDVDDEDDWRVWVQFWLLAFPNSELNLGGQ